MLLAVMLLAVLLPRIRQLVLRLRARLPQPRGLLLLLAPLPLLAPLLLLAPLPRQRLRQAPLPRQRLLLQREKPLLLQAVLLQQRRQPTPLQSLRKLQPLPPQSLPAAPSRSCLRPLRRAPRAR